MRWRSLPRRLCFKFDRDKFFFKEKVRIYNRFEPLDSENGALPLLWDVFEALARVEGAEKALGYCDLQLVGSPAMRCLVFHSLLQQGYRMGVPEDDGDYRLFPAALEALVHQVHECGVIHVDLYPVAFALEALEPLEKGGVQGGD